MWLGAGPLVVGDSLLLAPETRKARLGVQRWLCCSKHKHLTLDKEMTHHSSFHPFPGRGQGRKSQCQIWDYVTKCQSPTVTRGGILLSTPQASIAGWDTAGLLWSGPCPPQGTRIAQETPEKESLCSWQCVQAVKPMTCCWQNKCSPLSALSCWARRPRCFPTHTPFLCCSEDELRTDHLAVKHLAMNWPCKAEFSMSTACQQLEGLLKQKKALKSVQKYLEPYSLVWQHQEKKFQREDLVLDKHRQGTGPEFLNNPETQSFLLRRCFLLCTILKQSVFSSTSRNYCSLLKWLPAMVKIPAMAQASSEIYFLEVTDLR